MSKLPKASTDFARYEEHIYLAMQWLCSDCGEYIDAIADVRKEEEAQAPDGPWASRQAHEAMEQGWYLPPLNEAAGLPLLFCLCPKCAIEQGVAMKKEGPNQSPQTTRAFGPRV